MDIIRTKYGQGSRRLDWDSCKAFLAVAEEGGLAAAARRLRESRTTLGRKIAALEAQLDAPLFARAADGLVLTSDGRKFKEHVEVMRAAALRAEGALTVARRRVGGVVKLSIGPTLAAHWLMPRLEPFIRDHQQLQLDIVTHPFPASVRRGQADIVLRAVDPGGENLTGRKIGRLGTGFYASSSYAARNPLPERREDWKGHQIIGFADRESNTHLPIWNDSVTKNGRTVMRCSSQGDMLAAARAGLGICALSCVVAVAYPELIRVAPQKLRSVSDLWLLAHPDLTRLPAVRALVDFITDCVRADRALLLG
jgi:DNA-binding transcriptional LysR family regulator